VQQNTCTDNQTQQVVDTLSAYPGTRWTKITVKWILNETDYIYLYKLLIPN